MQFACSNVTSSDRRFASKAFQNPFRPSILHAIGRAFAEEALTQSRSLKAENQMNRKPKMQTTPRGVHIPIPKRGDFFNDLKKAATPEKSVKRPKK